MLADGCVQNVGVIKDSKKIKPSLIISFPSKINYRKVMTSMDILQQILSLSRENKIEIHKMLRKIAENIINELIRADADELIGKGNKKKDTG